MLEAELVPATEKKSRCLMIVLHGLGDSMEGYRWLPKALELPWLSYLLANAPDSYFSGYSWYDFSGDVSAGVERSRELLFTMLDEQRKAGWPTEQTILFGFSQGGLMTIEIGLRYPQLLAGLISVSGYLDEPERLVRELSPVALQQRFLITHGTDDPLIPFTAVRQQITLLKSAGVQIEWHEFPKAHTIAGDNEIAVIRDFVRSCFGR